MKDSRLARILAPAILVALVIALPFVLRVGADSASASPASSPEGSGRVVETMDAGGYTYALIAFAEGEAWFAGPTTPMAVDADIVVPAGMLMQAFRSESLDRTFDEIWFVGGFDVSGGGAGSGAMGGMMGGAMGDSPHGAGGMPGHPPVDPAAEVEGFDLEGIEKLEGGVTVAEAWEGRAALVGEEVALRGRVVKFLPEIMGKNWIHVRDGSGDGEAGTNDLTITTDSRVNEGDMVQVRGVLLAARDFGMGYRYDLIIEDASVTVE